MTANSWLAEERGVSSANVQEINKLHEKLNTLIVAWAKEPFSEERKEEIHQIEYALQRLWGFSQDRDYHTWAKLYEFRCQWVGKQFICKKTGAVFAIPDDVKERDFFSFGKCAVDVGRLNAYSRLIGDVEAI